MSFSPEKLNEVVRSKVLQVLQKNCPPDFKNTDAFKELGADSLQIVEILSLCMRELRLKIPRSDMGKITNATQLVEAFVAATKNP